MFVCVHPCIQHPNILLLKNFFVYLSTHFAASVRVTGFAAVNTRLFLVMFSLSELMLSSMWFVEVLSESGLLLLSLSRLKAAQ